MPQFLTEMDEAIVRAVARYRFMTAEDIGRLLYEPSSFSHVRARLKRLSGGDGKQGFLLYRFSQPDAKGGNPVRVYTLGTEGRVLLGLDTGKSRAVEPRVVGFYHLFHNLTVTRVLVAAAVWGRLQKAFELTAAQPSYELAGAAVIPDAWLLFTRRADNRRYPFLVEIDNGTVFAHTFKEQVGARLTFIESGEYERVFGIHAVKVVYLTTGSQTRLANLRGWVEEVLRETEMEDWGPVFKLALLDPETIYNLQLFTERLFQQPFKKTPVSLFD